MKLIPLTQGQFAIIDDEDEQLLSKYRWYAAKAKPGYFYAVRADRGQRIAMHRFLAGQPGLAVDHINGDTLDNRRSNLRAVSAAKNAQNLTKPSRAKSGHRNIFTSRYGYIVRVIRDGSTHYGGHFATIADAITRRDELIAHIASFTRAA